MPELNLTIDDFREALADRDLEIMGLKKLLRQAAARLAALDPPAPADELAARRDAKATDPPDEAEA